MKTMETINKYVKTFRKAQEAKKAAEAEMKKATEWLLTAGNVTDSFEDVNEVKALFAEYGVTYVAAYISNSIETSRLKVELPDVYKEYLKASPKKHSIR